MSLENTALTPSQDANRNAILDASRELFARFGYKKTTMEDIAMALRKGKSSLYYYFKNKEEIFQAVIELESELLYSRLKEVVAGNSAAPEKLRAYVKVRMETIGQLAAIGPVPGRCGPTSCGCSSRPWRIPCSTRCVGGGCGGPTWPRRSARRSG